MPSELGNLSPSSPSPGDRSVAAEPMRGRVLLTVTPEAQQSLRNLFRPPVLRQWEPHVAFSFEQARFLLQHDQWEALLLDESVLPWHDPAGLAWLASQREVPGVLLTSPDPDLIARALDGGVQQWLPRDLVLQYPGVLAAALGQASRQADLWRACRVAGQELRECKRQVSRLINRIWDSAVSEAQSRWHPQHYLLGRLQEEMARADRYAEMVSVAVGEVVSPADDPDEASRLGKWAAEHISRAKRRCDLAGQYGPNGFLLILVHTAEPGAVQCCHRLRGLLESAAEPGARQARAHFGVATFSPDLCTPKALLGRAEVRLEEAKAEQPE